VYAGSLKGLMEHATERVVAATEPASDLPRLVELVEDNGWAYETSDDEVSVTMPTERSADLYRVTAAAGLILRMLNPEADTLETVFLRLTGATDTELSEERRAQRHGDGG